MLENIVVYVFLRFAIRKCCSSDTSSIFTTFGGLNIPHFAAFYLFCDCCNNFRVNYILDKSGRERRRDYPFITTEKRTFLQIVDYFLLLLLCLFNKYDILFNYEM